VSTVKDNNKSKSRTTGGEDELATQAIVSSAHLADASEWWQLSEFEYALTMTFNAFSRWMTHCMAAVGYKDFNPLDILILHHVNHRDKAKRLTDIAFVLNIDDTHTINYAMKKLIKAELVIGQKARQEAFYQTTELGKQVCDKYRVVRRNCLLNNPAGIAGYKFDEVRHLAMMMRSLSGLYDQAARAAASL